MNLREIFRNKKGFGVILIIDALVVLAFLVIAVAYLIVNQEDLSLLLASIKESLR